MSVSPPPDPGRPAAGEAVPDLLRPADPGSVLTAAQLAACNRQLADRGIRLRLERRGGNLGLRGPLPRPDAAAGWQVQRLSLGLRPDGLGLARALLLLEQVQQELQRDSFRWDHWRRSGAAAPARPAVAGAAPAAALPLPLRSRRRGAGSPASIAAAGIGPAGSAGPNRSARPVPQVAATAPSSTVNGHRRQQRRGSSAAASGPRAGDSAGGCSPLAVPLQQFELAFFAEARRRRALAGSRSTWQAAYQPYLRRLAGLAGAGPLSLELLERTLESYELASRSRQQCAIALAALARQQGLELPADWNERGAGYGLHRARFRQLPSDGRILSLVEAIPNPAWRLVYGLMATYGLRNHEVFFCDLSGLAAGGDRVLRVLPTSKTGEHQVWPFQPDWVERFGLAGLGEQTEALPPICTDLRHTTLKQVGQRVAEQFRRYSLPITPYDLRHAWAVRTIHIGLPDTVAARMMGHSVTIHTRTYHHWITRRDQQQAVDAALARQRSA
ncbi:MAG: site-specific integrase [Synechococcus sp.]|nr:site-specific integrase [Synechococcus sp.]